MRPFWFLACVAAKRLENAGIQEHISILGFVSLAGGFTKMQKQKRPLN